MCILPEDRGQGCSSSPLQLDIKEGDPTFQFLSMVNLTVEVLVKGVQEVISMWPNGKDIIYVPEPHLAPHCIDCAMFCVCFSPAEGCCSFTVSMHCIMSLNCVHIYVAMCVC